MALNGKLAGLVAAAAVAIGGGTYALVSPGGGPSRCAPACADPAAIPQMTKMTTLANGATLVTIPAVGTTPEIQTEQMPGKSPYVVCDCNVTVANEWVSTSGTGGDFATFNAAYQASHPGDIIAIKAGTYGDQTIEKRSSPAEAAPAVVFTPATTTVSVGSISLGTYGSTTGPSWVAIQGLHKLTNTGFDVIYNGSGPVATHDALLNTTVARSGTTDSQGALVYILDATNILIQGNDIGPACCSSDGIGVEIRSGGEPNPASIRIIGNKIHDLSDTCSEWPTLLGSCAVPANRSFGSGICSSGNCDHVDGMQIFGSATLNIERNAVYLQGDHKQGIFLQTANGGTFSNITIANNAVSGTSDQALLLSGPGTGLWSGYAKILYNTVLYGSSGISFALYNLIFVPGSTVTIAGNIFAGQAGNQSGGGCAMTFSDSSTLTPTWSKNLQSTTTGCGTDVSGTGTFVQSTYPGSNPATCTTGTFTGCVTATGVPNLDLSGAQTAVNGGESTLCGPGKTVTVDLHGRTRPLGGTCDDGMDEAG